MKTLFFAVLLLAFSAVAQAQLPVYNGRVIYSQYPDWYGNHYYQPQYYWGGYGYGGGIYNQRIGNTSVFFGTGDFDGFSGESIQIGPRFRATNVRRGRYYYGW